MKKIVMFCLAALVGAGACYAARPAAKKKSTTTVFATDIDCEHCVSKIMNNVPSLGKGVEDVEVDVATKRVTVTYDPSKNSDERIVEGLSTLKVKAEAVETDAKAAKN